MNDFILDLWHDLREKRLWPVAAALLVALLAVPFVLIKPAEEAPTPAVPAASTKPAGAIDAQKALLTLKGDSPSDNSALREFLSKNPFKPMGDLAKESGVVAQTSDPGGAEPAGSGAAGGESGSTAGASGGGSTGGDEGGGSTGGGKTGGSDKPKEKRQQYTYAIDLTLTKDGEDKKIKRLDPLEILPSSKNPLLVFLGVNPDDDEAAFLVDSAVQTSGKGRCKPSRDECSFLYLERGEKESFTDPEGDAYAIKINRIRKVPVGKATSSRWTREKRAKGASGDWDRRDAEEQEFFDFMTGAQP